MAKLDKRKDRTKAISGGPVLLHNPPWEALRDITALSLRKPLNIVDIHTFIHIVLYPMHQIVTD